MSHRLTPEQMLETCLGQMRSVLADHFKRVPLPTIHENAYCCDGCPLEVDPDPYPTQCLHPDSPDNYAPEPGKCGLFIRPLLPPVVTP